MKGILILGFNKSPGAYIDVEYPKGVADSLRVKTSDLMNIYALHRMRRMEPNYIQMKIKNVSIASFYTGFSFKHYVGRPDFAITVFLSDNEMPPNDFEGMVRRMAIELLPERDDDFFDHSFVSHYEKLKEYDLEPYWEEYIEGEGSKIATIQAEIKEEEPDDSVDLGQMEDLSFDDQFEKFEKEELKDELRELQELINSKNEIIREINERLLNKVSDSPDHSAEVNLIKTQLDEANEKLDDWSLRLMDFNEKNAILMETVRKLTEMSMQQTEEMERQGRKILELKFEVDEKESKIEELNNKVVNAKVEMAEFKDGTGEAKGELSQQIEDFKNKINELEKDNDVHLDTISGLKFEIKELKDNVSSEKGVQDNLADDLIDLKKEVKILRRERDHYKEIVKEKNLLE